MNKSGKTIAVALLGLSLTAGAEVTVYPAPEGAALNNSFSVDVREPGGTWKPLSVYEVKVDEVKNARHNVRKSSMAYFDFDGKAEIRVRANGRKIEKAAVRPFSYDIKPRVDGNEMTFTIDRPRLMSVEVNGEIFDNLQLFANPVDENRPKDLKKFRKNKDNIYFGPGYHKLDTLKIGSGKTVYIAGGAVVDGVLEVENAENVRVFGRGMVYPYRKMGLSVRNSRNVAIDGLFSTQCAVGGSRGVEISNVKVMSYYGWGDGFNVFASSDVHYDGVFARTSDDCTTIYATRKGFTGGCENILTENSVLWADVAHPFMIGLHGNSKNPDTISNVLYRNIDVLDMQEFQIDYQGVFAIITGDNNTVKDVTFDNIRVENFRRGRLFDIRIAYNKKYCTAPGGCIENILFKDIIYNGDRSEMSMIIGYDDERMVKGVRFENLVVNGEKIYDKMPGKPGWYKTGDMMNLFIGEHVEDVVFE